MLWEAYVAFQQYSLIAIEMVSSKKKLITLRSYLTKRANELIFIAVLEQLIISRNDYNSTILLHIINLQHASYDKH